MVKKFTAQVDDIISVNKQRMVALSQASIQELIDQAQLSDDKGGKMRVDTGFLRASGQLSFDGLPTGPTRGDAEQDYEFDEQTVIAGLAGLELGIPVFFGWTANYARVREMFDGFLSSAIQNWPSIVDKFTEEIKMRIRI